MSKRNDEDLEIDEEELKSNYVPLREKKKQMVGRSFKLN
jgi:hypothetical protein